MTRRPFGPTGALVARIGQGTFLMEHAPRGQIVATLRRGLDLGLTHIDTAEMYGDGEVERRVGEAIAGRREEVFLVSKVLPENASRTGTIEACEASLRRLGTDRLDCFLLHWPGSHPLEDTIAAFESLVEAGKIRCFGVSNFDRPGLERTVAIAGPGKLACNQIFYHLGERSSENEVIPWCEAHGVAVVGYTPFGRSVFPPAAGAGVLGELAARRGVSVRQLALAFLTRRPALFAIPKAATAAHLVDNTAAADIELEPDELRAIDAAFPMGPARRGVARI